MGVDHGDGRQEMDRLKRRTKAVELAAASSNSPSSTHAGSGTNSVSLGAYDASGSDSIAIGDNGEASGDSSVAVGPSTSAHGLSATAVGDVAQAWGDLGSAFGSQARANVFKGTALGANTRALHSRGTAVGEGAQTTAADQVMLGKSGDQVVAAGTLLTPSARDMKTDITPAPKLVGVFPGLYEWAYKDDEKRTRHIGPMADDLVGTEAERFVHFDADGHVAGYAKCDLHTVQIAALLHEVTALRAEFAALKNERG